MQKRLLSLCLFLVLLCTIFPSTAAEKTLNKEPAAKVKDFYTTTLEGMAGRRLYVYGLIDGVSGGELPDETLGIDQPLTTAAGTALFNRLCGTDSEKFQQVSAILSRSTSAVSQGDFTQALCVLTGNVSTAGETNGPVTRGGAFYLLSKALDSEIESSGQTLKELLLEQGIIQYRDEVLTPNKLIVSAVSLDDILSKVEEAMDFAPSYIIIQAPPDALEAFKELNQADRDARCANTGTERYLFDSYLSAKSLGLKVYDCDGGVMIEMPHSLAHYVHIRADAQDWLRYYKDSTLSDAYNTFMQEEILPLKEQYPSERDLIEAVQKVICDKAQYDYAAAEKMDFSFTYRNGAELSAVISETANTHSIVGFLQDGKIVCDGYAETFYCCMRELGFECIQVFGLVGNAYHSWNKVRLSDGNWYNVDVCWDDTDSLAYSDIYFLKSDAFYRGSAHVPTNYMSSFYNAN